MQREKLQARELDRRRSHRQTACNRSFWFPTPGKIVNASEGGMAVHTAMKLEVGKTYTFRTRYRSKILQIPGIVKWSKFEVGEPGENGVGFTYFRSGILFADSLSPDARDFLLDRVALSSPAA